jgi:hypothetical protein
VKRPPLGSNVRPRDSRPAAMPPCRIGALLVLLFDSYFAFQVAPEIPGAKGGAVAPNVLNGDGR